MKRKRKVSPEAEIRAKAKQIMAEREAEAYKAAALMIVGRKLDEIADLLRTAGFSSSNVAQTLQGSVARQVSAVNPASQPAAIQHPCTYCGVESVYRTKPNRYNRTGTWLCRAHLAMRKQHEQVGTAQPQVINAVETEVVVNGGPALPPEKTDTGVDVGIAHAFAALGVN